MKYMFFSHICYGAQLSLDITYESTLLVLACNHIDEALCHVLVHIREMELKKAEEQLRKLTSSTEAKIDKSVMLSVVLYNLAVNDDSLQPYIYRNI
jgi:hypothetical protein